MRRLDRIAFIVGIAALLFLGGFAVAKLEVFPHDVLARAGRAAVALYRELEPSGLGARRIRRVEAGVRHVDRAATADVLRLLTLFEPDGMRAVLIDRDGAVAHEWRTTFSAVYGEAAHVERQSTDGGIHWHGGQVFPNGDLALNFEGGNFPYGGGMVMLDRRSRVRWQLARNTHHDFNLTGDGGIVTPSHEFRWDGIAACSPWLEPPYYEDQVLFVSPTGEVQEEISVLEAVCTSEFRSLLMQRGTFAVRGGERLSGDDPLHLNDVEVVTAELAPRFPMARAGDLLVSLRNVNALAIIDRRTGKVRWHLLGPFARQHDPDLLPNGHIMLFDNHGGSMARGGSRVIEIDPLTQAIVWTFEGTEEAPFASERAGNQTLLPNGNLLIAESWGGRALEVTRDAAPRVIWDYVSLRGADAEGGRPNALMRVDGIPRADLPFLDARTAAE